ncbi:hypothetical protein F5880DRAFT_1728728 [Lentinula raphanica]|nr:hypothetical protein F5880DRAFT_1728728 [Lentinula raphanica]
MTFDPKSMTHDAQEKPKGYGFKLNTTPSSTAVEEILNFNKLFRTVDEWHTVTGHSHVSIQNRCHVFWLAATGWLLRLWSVAELQKLKIRRALPSYTIILARSPRIKNEDQSARFSVVAEVMGKQYYFWMSNGNIRHEVRTNTRVTWLSRKAKFEIPFSDSKESAILQAYSEYPTASSWKRDSYIVGVLESWYRRSGVSEREIESDMLTLEDEFRGKRRQVEKKNLRDTQPRQKKRVRLSQGVLGMKMMEIFPRCGLGADDSDPTYTLVRTNQIFRFISSK